MQRVIQINTPAHKGLYDITRQVEAIVGEVGCRQAWSLFMCRELPPGS